MCAALFLFSCSKPASNEVRTYSLGQQIGLGHLIYTVFETQWLPQIGQGASARVPQHRFFVVRLSVVNSGGSESPVPNLAIEDDNGTTYTELTNGEGVPQWVGLLRQLKPADSLQGMVVFDAPPAHYKLRLGDENLERAALVDIPLSFAAETPEVPIPVDAKRK
jgi:hypothetical protein